MARAKPDVVASIRTYDAWLRGQLPVVAADLRLKHARIAADAFSFLRGTFFRWVEICPTLCPELCAGPAVLAVGDLHVENFGTWRDAEARLVWGINDVDEAATMPFALDLCRLAASALLAERHLALDAETVCAAILAGYRAGLEAPRPFVLEEAAGPLRAMALSADREPDAFWAKLAAERKAKPSPEARLLLRGALPAGAVPERWVARVSGIGSLGRPRFALLGIAGGRRIAREVKAMVPSAFDRKGRAGAAPERLLTQAVRAPDPFHGFADGWQIRRLAPHCSRIELAMLPKKRDEDLLLTAMGFETANFHAGSRDAVAAIRRDLKRRSKRWLFDAATRLAEATRADWKAYRRASRAA
jgi:hypothetical protein